MDKRTRAAWRKPPRRFGPIEPAAEPLWIALLDRGAPWLCAIVAVTVLTVAGLAYAADLQAGHLLQRWL